MTIAADVQVLETRVLLSFVLFDKTPVTTIKTVAGTSTGDVVVATFLDNNRSASQSDFVATVDWAGTVTGTPTVSVQLVSQTATGSTWEVVGNATYANAGYAVPTVKITDVTGSTLTTSHVSFEVFSAADSALLTDTTPATTIKAVAGTDTGNVVLATFTDAIPAGGLLSNLNLPGAIDTQATGVSGSNVVGYYHDASNVAHGFLYDSLTSTYTTLDPTGSTGTFVTGVSGSKVVGYFNDASSVQHGFLYDSLAFTTIDPTGSIDTQATGVSGSNVVGNYHDAGHVAHGFLYDSLTSSYTTIDPPGSAGTTVTGVSGNQVVGVYADAGNRQHGFLYNRLTSTFTTLDPTGSTGTNVTGDSGSNIFGDYSDASSVQHGFVYDSLTSMYTTLDPTGSTGTSVTGVSGSNVVGVYTDAGQVRHGFLYNSLTSTYTTFDPTGSTGTVVSVISGSNVAGLSVAGLSIDANNVNHGFLYQIAPVQTDFTPTVDWGGALTGTPTLSVQLVSQMATGSTWEIVGNATYAAAGDFTTTVTVTDATGSSVKTTNTQFNVASSNSSPPAVFSFAGEYAVATTGGNAVTLASISQSGTQLTFNGSVSTTGSVVTSPAQLLANGAVVATYQNSRITFASGPFAGQTWTKLNLPTDYTNSRGAATHIIQNGASLTFVDSVGGTSPGHWISPTQVFADAWNEPATIALGKLLWQDGSIWSENLVLHGTKNGAGTTTIAAAPSQVFVFDYVNAANKPVHLVQTGTPNVIFIDAAGHMSLGTFISPTQASTPYYPNDIATISLNAATVSWQDGSLWTKTAPTTAITVTNFTNAFGVPVHLIQNGSSQLAFVDSLGRTSLGTLLNPTTAQTDLYGAGDLATISANTVSWQDGSLWTMTNILPLTITLTDTNGAVSHVRLTSPTTLIGLDRALQGLTATRLNDKLFWSNGAVWDNLDLELLNALFELGPGFP